LNHSKRPISLRISLFSRVIRGLRLNRMKALQAQTKSAQAKDTNLTFNLPSNPHANKPVITSVIWRPRGINVGALGLPLFLHHLVMVVKEREQTPGIQPIRNPRVSPQKKLN
jgi:hypothetical protein